MALLDFKFPGVTLNQQFEANSVASAAGFSVACIGQQRATHRHDVADEAAEITSSYTKAAGIEAAALPGKAAGSTVQAGGQALFVKNGFFSYAEATKGSSGSFYFGQGDISGQQVKFNIDLKSAAGVLGTRGVEVGDGAVASYSGTKASKVYYVIGFKETAEGYRTAIFDSDIDDTDIDKITFCAIYSGSALQGTTGTTVADVAFSISNGEVTVYKSVFTVIPGAGTADGKCYLVDSVTVGSKIATGNLFIEYIESASTYVGKIGIVSSPADVDNILGKPCKDNPLALAVYFALMTGGVPVYFTAVISDQPLSYTNALSLFDRYSNVYSIVPAIDRNTADATRKSIVQAVTTACESISSGIESKVRRTVWYGIDCSSSIPAGADGSQVKQDLLLKKCTQSYRAQCVWADGAIFDGEEIPNYAIAAAAAGMRSGNQVHRPISNLAYNLFSVVETHGLSLAWYASIAENGIWIVANNGDGAPINMRQLTTAMSDNNINLNEESCVSNADNIALSLCRLGEDYVGNSNINGNLIIRLQEMISAVMNGKTADRSGNVFIGPQLLSWKLVSIAQDETALDHVNATITCTPPRPFNRFNMTLTIL